MRLVFYVFHPPFGHPKGDITGGTLLIFFWIPASPVHPEPVEGLEGVARLAGRGWTLLSWLFVRPLRPLRRGTFAVYFLFTDLNCPVPAGASAETGRDSKEIKGW
jgi:hypothetical protein